MLFSVSEAVLAKRGLACSPMSILEARSPCTHSGGHELLLPRQLVVQVMTAALSRTSHQSWRARTETSAAYMPPNLHSMAHPLLCICKK